MTKRAIPVILIFLSFICASYAQEISPLSVIEPQLIEGFDLITDSNRTGDCHDGALDVIPVVFHVIHNGEDLGTLDNPDALDIMSQLDRTNEQFRKVGVSSSLYPDDAVDTKIEFKLAKSDPDGAPHSGMNWYYWDDIPNLNFTPPYGTDDLYHPNNIINAIIKEETVWDTDRYLNVWVFRFIDDETTRLNGNSTFPTGTNLGGQNAMNGMSGTALTDGVVMSSHAINNSMDNRWNWFTHELGHYLGLFHTFRGDSPIDDPNRCENVDDYCDDTPTTLGNNSETECNQNSSSCNPGDRDMIENFMDYSVNCFQIFTNDQSDRMTEVLLFSPRRPTHVRSSSSFDTYEPNDSPSEAADIFPDLEGDIVDSSIYSYIIRPGNPVEGSDWYKLDLINPGTLEISLSDLPDDYDLELYYEGQLVAGSFNTGTTSEQISVNYNSNDPGEVQIYVHESYLDWSLCHPYTLSILWTPEGGQCVPIAVTISSTNESTVGAMDGTATVTINSGTPPYDILWSNGGTTSTISNLSPGTYYVTVTADDGCTYSASVYVGTEGEPDPFCYGQTTFTSTSGSFNDGSGSEDYANNSSCFWLIDPVATVSSINLSFSSFSLDPSDQVNVYDGSSNAATLIGSFTGTSLPASITSSGSELYVEFISDGTTTSSGWSAIYTSNILPSGTSMRYYEYWFDDDYGSKISSTFSPRPTYTFDRDVSTDDLLPGAHTFHIRFRDEHGLYTAVQSQPFFKGPEYATSSKRLVSYEYWYDDDYQNRIDEAISLNETAHIDDELNTSELVPGVHTFHIRSLDNAGHWSAVISQHFYKIKNSVGIPNLITAYRYWFDEEDEDLVAEYLQTPVNPYHLITDIDASGLDVGEHRLHIQFKDTVQLWSSVLTDTFLVNAFVEAEFYTNDSSICAGNEVDFTNTSTGASEYHWEFGDGSISTLENPVHTYDDPGSYTVELVAIDPINDISDTLIAGLLIDVFSSYDILIEETSCNPADTGTVVSALESIHECDSVITTITTLLPEAIDTLIYRGCEGDGFSIEVNGTTYDESNPTGLEVFSEGAANGCDSTVVIDLYYYPDLGSGMVSYLGCEGDGYSVEINGTTYSETNTQGIELFLTAFGCDSIVEVELIFQERSEGSFNYDGCEGDGFNISVNGTLYNESNPTGEEIITGGAANGCDSIVTIDLFFDDCPCPPVFHTESYSGCSDDGYTISVNGTIYNESNPSGMETFTGASSMGCDSIVTIDLEFLPNSFKNINYDGCEGDGYAIEVNGTIYDEANPTGIEILAGGAANGCDSTVTIDLFFDDCPCPPVFHTVSYIGCSGDGYSVLVNGSTYNEANPSGTETIVGGSSMGCDSVVTVSLNFQTLPTGSFNYSGCVGDGFSIIINGTSYNESNQTGQETLIGGAANGCDSIVSVQLIFHSSDAVTQMESSCNPTDTGTVVEAYTNINDCDSIVTIVTSLLPSYEVNLVDTICDDESIVIGGVEYDATGIYDIELNTIAGCDSTIILDLTVQENQDGEVEFNSIADDPICLDATPINLIPFGTPPDGTFDGHGVSNGSFNPMTAGVGPHTLYYHYEYGNECVETDSVSVEVEVCIGIEEISALSSLEIFPNPFTDATHIKYHLNEYSSLEIEIFDVQGKSIGVVVNERQAPGTYEYEIKGDELAQGVYEVRFSDGTRSVSKKIVLVR